MPSLRRVVARVQPILVVLAFAIMARLLAQQWDGLRAHRWQIHGSWLALSGALIVSGWLIEIQVWRRALALLGGRLRFADAIGIWFTSLIVRYVPGTIWHPLSMTVRCQAHDIRPPVTLASMILMYVLHVLAVAMIASIDLGFGSRLSATVTSQFGTAVPAALLAGTVLIVLVAPARMLRLVNRLVVKFGGEPFPLQLSTASIALLLGLCLTEWIVLSAGFTALVAALAIPGATPLSSVAPQLMAAYPIAWLIGFLTVITPGGLAIREGVLYLLLSPTLGRADAILVALAMRVWEVALELVMAGGVVARGWGRSDAVIKN